MDVRTDTSSGRFGGQWAYLNNQVHYGSVQSRSLPPSSYLPRTDPSNTSAGPALLPLYHVNLSRTNLLRTRPTSSAGGHSSVTTPSQPVVVREHVDAGSHSRPTTRRPGLRRPDRNMEGNRHDLPQVSAFSIQGILDAIQEDIEGDVDAIAEILGRSRLVLADQHDSHLPPQGIIRDTVHPLQAVEEASSSTERLVGDNILILGEDASLVDGSNAGSAAYGLLERLQAIPRTQRHSSGMALNTAAATPIMPSRTVSSPAVLPDHTATFVEAEQRRRSTQASRLLLNTSSFSSGHATTNAVVSEVYLSAGANGRTASNPPVVSESGRHYPLYSYDESALFEDPAELILPVPKPSRLQNLLAISNWEGLTSWLARSSSSSPPVVAAETGATNAERRLREVLDRQRRHPTLPEEVVPDTEEGTLYD